MSKSLDDLLVGDITPKEYIDIVRKDNREQAEQEKQPTSKRRKNMPENTYDLPEGYSYKFRTNDDGTVTIYAQTDYNHEEGRSTETVSVLTIKDASEIEETMRTLHRVASAHANAAYRGNLLANKVSRWCGDKGLAITKQMAF